VTRVLLILGVLFGALTLIGSLYYAFGMDSESEAMFRLAQASCFTTEGAESVERCAPLTRATLDGPTLAFFSQVGFVSCAAVLGLAGLSAWLLVSRRHLALTPGAVPRWTAWVFVSCCGWLLLSPLDKIWDEEYAEGLSDQATGVLSQYFPAVIGQSSARVWLGSSDAAFAAIGRLVGQAFILWVIAMFVVSVLWLLRSSRRGQVTGAS
jgi:hypothetical protein